MSTKLDDGHHRVRRVAALGLAVVVAGGCTWHDNHRYAYSSCMARWDDAELAHAGPGAKVYLKGEEQAEYCWRYAQRATRRLPG